MSKGDKNVCFTGSCDNAKEAIVPFPSEILKEPEEAVFKLIMLLLNDLK